MTPRVNYLITSVPQRSSKSLKKGLFLLQNLSFRKPKRLFLDEIDPKK